MENLWGKPLLTDEEFAKLLEDDSDAGIWLALVDAAQKDQILNRVFGLSRHRGWSRFRTVMVCAYIMAQRHERVVQMQLDQLNNTLTVPKMMFCSKCSKELFTTDDGVTMRLKTSEERSASKSENCTH